MGTGFLVSVIWLLLCAMVLNETEWEERSRYNADKDN